MTIVTLREFRDADADELFEWMRDPVGVRMAAFTAADPDDRAAFDAHLARNRANPAVHDLAIEVDGEFSGTIAAFDIEGDREISYWIDPAKWGRGIAGAALAAFLERETGRPLHARAASSNVGSARVLTRAGFVEIGRDTGFANGAGAEVEETIFRLDSAERQV